MPQDLPKWFRQFVKTVRGKHAKTVIDHILKYGHITTEELKNLYGYDHPPRPARDVREQGVPLETFRITGSQGKKIAAYRFADPRQLRAGILSGRRVHSKQFKNLLMQQSGCKCGVCLTKYEARYLQIDHRIPYEVGGEGGRKEAVEEFQLICGSCNRAKSWSCEHCQNWQREKKTKVCKSCYWANPASYKHVAMLPVRRLDVIWTDRETEEYDRLAQMARQAGKPLSDFVKGLLLRCLSKLE